MTYRRAWIALLIFEVVPVFRLSRTLRGSCRQQNAAAEQVEAGMTIQLALDGF